MKVVYPSTKENADTVHHAVNSFIELVIANEHKPAKILSQRAANLIRTGTVKIKAMNAYNERMLHALDINPQDEETHAPDWTTTPPTRGHRRYKTYAAATNQGTLDQAPKGYKEQLPMQPKAKSPAPDELMNLKDTVDKLVSMVATLVASMANLASQQQTTIPASTGTSTSTDTKSFEEKMDNVFAYLMNRMDNFEDTQAYHMEKLEESKKNSEWLTRKNKEANGKRNPPNDDTRTKRINALDRGTASPIKKKLKNTDWAALQNDDDDEEDTLVDNVDPNSYDDTMEDMSKMDFATDPETSDTDTVAAPKNRKPNDNKSELANTTRKAAPRAKKK